MEHNKPSGRYHAFFILFNPSEEVTPWDDVENEAVDFFLEFGNQGDYGTIPSTSLHFFLEEEMDLSKQEDNIQTIPMIGFPPTILLNLHLNYKIFTQADKETQLKITLNGILFLIRYWKENLKVPNNVPIFSLATRFADHLKAKGLLIPEEEWKDLYFKAKQAFRFRFANDHKDGLQKEQILFDTREIENLLTNNLSNINLGSSVKECCFLYDIMDLNQPDAHKNYLKEKKKSSYGRNKDLLIAQLYDSNHFLFDEQGEPQDKKGQIQYFHKGILKAIRNLQETRRKPKDFNLELMYAEIDRTLTEYENQL